ncbi:winged helix DNA-binding domain-containing protein [Nocardioides sp. B-3]|uniref:winged helix DNA-binding domain-containing protein n=1 Tax=Nocardioides sp. B-3 TaxID=2895565 RepID=UPI002152CA4E|nr:winged helix DNA-binding domain-containing protein [Nocardioides sp. B-3]UUZ58497.1 winged helix DNA-binding domain-containing protein [Nocardioides sp. B-3]
MAFALEDLAALSLGRQFPVDARGVVDLVSATGPVQSQTARSPFIGLAARRLGTTHEEITAAYESGEIVRGSTIRGTVHTATPEQYAALGAATRVGQRTLWQRMLKLEHGTLDELWAATEEFAADWRTPDELQQHLHDWLVSHEGRDEVTGQQAGRYPAFGHGGLVRRPVNGTWSGQGAPVYRTLRPAEPMTPVDAVALHVRCHGPVSRHDIAWWSGLGLRVVDEAIDSLGPVGVQGPDGRSYVDVRAPTAGRSLDGVRFLPEFDALMCGYDPSSRDRFAHPGHLRRLWNLSNGMVLPPLLVDGRITGYWRATGSARKRPLEVVWFAGTRKPRQSELSEPVSSPEAALDITITGVTLTRESVSVGA